MAKDTINEHFLTSENVKERPIMPAMRDAQLARLDVDERLREAINHWRPDRPRRWLAKYGNISVEGQANPLTVQYRMLRHEAENKLSRLHPESTGGLASHSLHADW